MKRSMYSLILTDDIVAAIDFLAAQQGTSRSHYINQVLADHVRFITPEQQMRQLFSQLIAQIEQRNTIFRVQQQGSDAMLSIFGTVQYKYRPTIRYQVELSREMRHETIGRLKVSCRSQSRALLDAMDDFFRFWTDLEIKNDPQKRCGKKMYLIEDGRLTRTLLRCGMTDDTELGKAIGDYIRMFHNLLQSYFTGLQQGVSGAVLHHALEQQYMAIRTMQTTPL